MAYDLHCTFDLQQHKKTYINYLEVIIYEDGKVEYAIPSHQEKLISIGMKKLQMRREQFLNACPPAMYGNFLEWLLEITHCVSVWTCGYMATQISEEQQKVLDEFVQHHIMQNQKLND